MSTAPTPIGHAPRSISAASPHSTGTVRSGSGGAAALRSSGAVPARSIGTALPYSIGTALPGSTGTAPSRLRPALIAVAHGSRDPRSAETMSAVVEDIATARPDLDVRPAFLDLSAPSVEQVVDAVAAQGHTHAVVTPLLLGNAFHARVDLPGLLTAARARHPQLHLTQADVLGPDPRLISALRDRVMDAVAERDCDTGRTVGRRSLDRDDRIGIAVAAVGSSSTTANARTAMVARRLATITGWRTEICFATTEPTVAQAVSRLHNRGADRVLVAPWFLAPGLLTDRLIAAAPELVHADVIGPHSALTEIVWDRYAAAVTDALTLSA